jgi:hypothetical protein
MITSLRLGPAMTPLAIAYRCVNEDGYATPARQLRLPASTPRARFRHVPICIGRDDDDCPSQEPAGLKHKRSGK